MAANADSSTAAPPAPANGVTAPAHSPVGWLVIGLAVAVLVIVGFSIYAAREIDTLRDEQAALSERNRLDTLQIVRIQQNLSSVAGALRDMLEGTEPYPLSAWANTFARLRNDLEQALARERELAPVGRLPAEQAQLDEANRRFWDAMDRAFAQAGAAGAGAAADPATLAIVRGEASARHAELVSLVSQLVIFNTRVDEASAARARGVYDRVARQIYLLAAVLVAGVVVGGAILIHNTRRTFETVQGLAAERRALSWRMLTMQETLQTEFARELHDEFGQILTAVGMMLGRVRRKAAGPGGEALAPMVADLDEAQQVTQRTLDRIRTKSRLLHPVILDDFGLQQAVAWYATEFARQQGIDTRFEPVGEIVALPPDVATHLYRIVQESLTNVAKHAEASEVHIRLMRDADGIELSVSDDGKGPPPLGPARAGAAEGPGGIGITSMRERAALMGGTFQAGRGPRGGLHVVVWVPLAAAAPVVGQPPDEHEAPVTHPAPDGVR